MINGILISQILFWLTVGAVVHIYLIFRNKDRERTKILEERSYIGMFYLDRYTEILRGFRSGEITEEEGRVLVEEAQANHNREMEELLARIK